MTHQRLALRGEADRPPLSLEEDGAEIAFQSADRVADGARRKAEIVGREAEGARTGGSLEGAEGTQGKMWSHAE